ncbi:MAG: NAD(P)-dependent oxidoreductase [Chromatiales bacterium]
MKVSVIGLGAMGAGMAGNLQRVGLLSFGWNRTRERGEAAAERFGFHLANSLQEAAGSADLVITSVSADEDLLEVSAQLASVMQAGNIVLDTSTVSSWTAQQVAERLQAHGIHFLDAPVSGGREGAEQGTLVMMVGGDAAILKQICPVLEAISSKVVHMGDVGAGQAAKAVNQIMAAGINQAVTDALAFGSCQGLDMDKVIDVIQSGAADNWFLRHRGRSMCEGRFEPGFRIALHHKDLRICEDMLGEDMLGEQSSELVSRTLQHYQQLMDAGYGDEDISALYRLKRSD